MYSQLFVTKRHSRFLIFISFHTYIYITICVSPYQGHEWVVLSRKHKGGLGEQHVWRHPTPPRAGLLLCPTTMRLTCIISAAVTGKRWQLPFPGKAEMGMVCVMINLCVLHRPNLKCQPFRFCAILKEPFVEYLKATAHISQNRD